MALICKWSECFVLQETYEIELRGVRSRRILLFSDEETLIHRPVCPLKDVYLVPLIMSTSCLNINMHKSTHRVQSSEKRVTFKVVNSAGSSIHTHCLEGSAWPCSFSVKLLSPATSTQDLRASTRHPKDDVLDWAFPMPTLSHSCNLQQPVP